LQGDLKLTPTSYVVLGLLAECGGEATPYDLKRLLAASVANFWSLPHAQLYREPDRLASAGYVTERREQEGRRRRFYALTARGREALDAWLGQAPTQLPELRDAGVLKLFFGADPAMVAANQLPAHEAKLAEYEALHAQLDGHAPAGQLRALEIGIAHERAMIEIWRATSARRA
jgi:DNA-binding PadR family transcriptional regulator